MFVSVKPEVHAESKARWSRTTGGAHRSRTSRQPASGRGGPQLIHLRGPVTLRAEVFVHAAVLRLVTGPCVAQRLSGRAFVPHELLFERPNTWGRTA